jgi:hypothetical protein
MLVRLATNANSDVYSQMLEGRVIPVGRMHATASSCLESSLEDNVEVRWKGSTSQVPAKVVVHQHCRTLPLPSQVSAPVMIALPMATLNRDHAPLLPIMKTISKIWMDYGTLGLLST